MRSKQNLSLLSGMLGCLCYGGGDWLMMYGSTAHSGAVSWLIPVTEGMMLPVFIYWFYLQISGKTIFPKWMAFTNVLLIFGALKCLTLLMPDSAFRLGFTNGLMSESMVIWFAIMMIYRSKSKTAAIS